MIKNIFEQIKKVTSLLMTILSPPPKWFLLDLNLNESYMIMTSPGSDLNTRSDPFLKP